MAPLKRGRNLAEQEEESSPDDAAGRDSRKRARTSGEFHSSSGSDSEASDSSTTPSVGPYDSEDERALEERATQIIRNKFLNNAENIPMENGIIERVDCYNFMCHEHFSVELGPLINFIVGKNGSGKSAILTAITLCLGGKASVTNRGQSLKNFIKEGKDSATIIVRIKNQGDSAYLPLVYDSSIIIERHFTRNGTSGFRLKSASGRIVSTKKSDLDAITDYFALQIDNPMNVLSQDMARQFIGNSSPTEKYKFFVKGVQLEQLDQDYRLIEQFIDQIDAKLGIHQDEMKVLEQRRDKARARLALSDRQEGLMDRIKNLRAQVAWAQVEEREQDLEARKEDVLKLDEKIAALQSEVENCDTLYQTGDRELDIARQESQATKDRLNAKRDERKGVQEKHDEVNKERIDLRTEQGKISDYLKEVTERIKNTQEKIDEENLRLEGLDGGSNTRKMAELQERKEAVKQLEVRYKQHKRERAGLQDQVTRAEADLKSLQEPISSKQEELDNAQNRLRILTRDRSQQQNGFSDKMPLLLRAIQNERSFSQAPVGPVGQHVRLLKPQWSSVLESTFGNTLTSFLVTSKNDMNILSNIMQKVNCVCPIFIGNDTGRIDTSPHEPDSQFDTALRVLEIDNDLVRRQLIIGHGVEQMVLIEDLETASKVLFDGERPRNVKRCFCLDERDKRRGIHLAFSRAGEPTQSPVPIYTRNPRMKTDIEARINMQQETVDGLSRDLDGLVEQRRRAEARLDKCRESLSNHDTQDRELQLQSQKAEDVAQELSEEVDQGSLNDGRLQVLQSALDEAEGDKKQYEESYQDAVNALDEVIRRLRVLKRELAAKDVEIASAEQAYQEAKEQEDRVSAERNKALGKKNIAIGRVQEAKRDKEEAEAKRAEAEERVLDFSEKARIISDRVPINRGDTRSSLERKLDRLLRDRQRYAQQMGASHQEIAAGAAEAEAQYERSRCQVAEFETTSKVLKTTLANRKDRWDKFRSHITSRAKVQFQYLLSERSFRGKLLTDHKEKLLDIQIEPDITRDGSGHTARALSGGEKSFSQICLLLALWEAMGSPIRCLDEFDVYMDVINRKLAIDLLMGAARRSVGRQFILITPGSRAEIRIAPDVRVKELAEPERGQQTLSFST